MRRGTAQGDVYRKVWPGESENGKVFANITTASDENYLGLLEAQSKTYMAPVSENSLDQMGADLLNSRYLHGVSCLPGSHRAV